MIGVVRKSLSLKGRAVKVRSMLFVAVLAVAAPASGAAYAWSAQEDHGSWALIRCADGSNSTVTSSNGRWTVTSPGTNGRAGGQFGIMGQAAVAGCGEDK
jgi:hypothetical protein